MSIRVRYEERGNMMISNVFKHPDNGAQFQIRLFPADFKYQIYDVVAGGVYRENQARSYQKMLINAKRLLVECGIDLGTKETRKRI